LLDLLKNKFREYCIFKLYLYIFVNNLPIGSGTMVNTIPLGSGINQGSKILEFQIFETRDPKYLEYGSSLLFDFVFAFSNLISVKSLKPSAKH